MIVAIFAVPLVGLLFVNSDSDSILSEAKLRYETWEFDTVDYRFIYGRTAPVSSDIIFLAIDSPSLDVSTIIDKETVAASRPLSLMQSFPYPHELYPLIYDRLIGAGARAVGFDLFFPSPKPDDPGFQQALDKYRDKVVIGMNFSSDKLRTNDTAHNTHMDV